MSIFFPAYNDWGTIASLVVLAAAVVRDLTDDWEIIVVNDASPDHTPLILGELLRYVPHLPGSDGDRRHRHVARRDPPFGQRLTDLVDGQRSFSGVKFARWACASSRGRRVDSAG